LASTDEKAWSHRPSPTMTHVPPGQLRPQLSAGLPQRATNVASTILDNRRDRQFLSLVPTRIDFF
jgi:hypothetical protein